jgi:hypothetical protein
MSSAFHHLLPFTLYPSPKLLFKYLKLIFSRFSIILSIFVVIKNHKMKITEELKKRKIPIVSIDSELNKL